jgi:hypothetical protein
MSDPTVIVTPEMGLNVPTLVTQGPAAQADVSNDLIIIDGHDHSPGNGAPINLSGQPVDGPLSLQDNPLTNTQAIEFISQPSQLVGSQDVNTLYVNQNVLGFNDSNGVFHPLSGGSANIVNFTNFTFRDVSANFTIAYTDTYNLININTSGGAITGTLPIAGYVAPQGYPPSTGRLFVFRDVSNNAGTNNITIQVAPASGNTFGDNGNTTWVINSNGGYVAFYSDGVDLWWAWNQVVYSGQTLQLNESNFNMVGGNITTDNTSGTLTATGLTLTGNSAINVSTSSFINIDSAGQFNNSGTINNNGTTIGTNTLNAGKTTIGGTGSIQSNIGGGLQSITPGGIQNNGGANDWVGFATPRSRTLVYPLIPLGDPRFSYASGSSANGTWAVPGDSNQTWGANTTQVTNPSGGLLIPPNPGLIGPYAFSGGANDTIQQYVPIPVVHNNATLVSVAVAFIVNNPHPGNSGTLTPGTDFTYPTINVFRVDQTVNTGAGLVYLNTAGSTPTPYAGSGAISGATWVNANNIKYLTFTCNTNNTINNAQYTYYLILTEEGNTYGMGGNLYMSMVLSYDNIQSMQFST